MSDEIVRKIAVIFATDVVGYSKHMELDESKTVKSLRVREKLLAKLFKKHDGRLFNTGGDSFLAEFPSAVGAIECAVEFQKEIKELNTLDKTGIPLVFRIGINTGDVIKEKDNFLGDGVNIASRLEALAQTGGITISKGVYDYVKGKTKYEYNDLGVQKIKQNEFHAYDIILDPSHKRKLKTQKSNTPLIVTITIIIVTGLISLFYFNYNPQIIKINNNKVSLLIMPFENKSGDEDTNLISGGITEHIWTTLIKYDELFVFDNSSVQYFINKSLSKSELKDDYGVQFILEASIQVSGLKLRVNIKLYDLLKGVVTWSETLDFENKDIFEVQDSISDSVLSNIIPGVMALTVGDARTVRKFTPEVHLNRLKGRVAYETNSIEGLYEYERLLKSNRKLEPQNIYLDNDEAWFLMGKVWFGSSENADTDIKNAYRLVLNTAKADPNYAYASNLAAMIERHHIGKLDTACNRIDKLTQISIDPSNMANVASLARHCSQYKKSLKIYKDVLKSAPHFSLWFKEEYAWTFLMTEFYFHGSDYTDARSYIESQLAVSYAKDGVNEMWLTMLAYMASKQGDNKSAANFIKRQSEMDNPISKTWFDNYLHILNENESFKNDFFDTIDKLGVS
jgi:adenylate cyclase